MSFIRNADLVLLVFLIWHQHQSNDLRTAMSASTQKSSQRIATHSRAVVPLAHNQIEAAGHMLHCDMQQAVFCLIVRARERGSWQSMF